MRKLLTLPEILDSVGMVLVDGSIRSRGPHGDNFARGIYEASNYSQIDAHKVQDEIRNIEGMIDLFHHEKALTLPEVAEEIEVYVKIIGNKLGGIGHIPKGRRKRVTGRTSKEGRRREIGRKSEEGLKTLQGRLWDLYTLARANSVNMTMPSYEPLVDMIKIIDGNIGLRKNTSYIYGECETKEETHPNDTDERIIAAAHCFSMSRDEPFGVLTGDTGFVRLWGVTSKLIGADDFLPYNKRFREGCEKEVFRLYVQDRDDSNSFSLPSKGMKTDYLPRFKIHRLNPRDNEVAKQQILGLMKKAGWSDEMQDQADYSNCKAIE